MQPLLEQIKPGDFCNVKITDAKTFSLVGKLVK